MGSYVEPESNMTISYKEEEIKTEKNTCEDTYKLINEVSRRKLTLLTTQSWKFTVPRIFFFFNEVLFLYIIFNLGAFDFFPCYQSLEKISFCIVCPKFCGILLWQHQCTNRDEMLIYNKLELKFYIKVYMYSPDVYHHKYTGAQ